MEKLYVSYKEIHSIVKELSSQIVRDSYNPEVIISIAAGGLLPARLFRNCLRIPLYIVCVNLYEEEDKIPRYPKPFITQWLDKKALEFIKGKRILLVDDFFYSGITLKQCIKEIQDSCEPKSISFAVLHYKKSSYKIDIEDDIKYYIGREIESSWVYYPWENTSIPYDDKIENPKYKEEENTYCVLEKYVDNSNLESYIIGQDKLPVSHCNLF